MSNKLDLVEKKHQEIEKKEKKQAEEQMSQPLDTFNLAGVGQNMLMPPTASNIDQYSNFQTGFNNNM